MEVAQKLEGVRLKPKPVFYSEAMQLVRELEQDPNVRLKLDDFESLCHGQCISPGDPSYTNENDNMLAYTLQDGVVRVWFTYLTAREIAVLKELIEDRSLKHVFTRYADHDRMHAEFEEIMDRIYDYHNAE